jgi:hypothetical protein
MIVKKIISNGHTVQTYNLLKLDEYSIHERELKFNKFLKISRAKNMGGGPNGVQLIRLRAG